MDQDTNDILQELIPPVDDTTQQADATQPALATPQTDDSGDDQALKEIENMSNEEFLEAYASSLLEEKDLGEMDEETRSEMVKDLVERVTAFINRAVLEALPEEKLNEVDQLADNNDSLEEINKIVQESGIDTDRITSDALEKFREIYLGPNENMEA